MVAASTTILIMAFAGIPDGLSVDFDDDFFLAHDFPFLPLLYTIYRHCQGISLGIFGAFY
tara:strand:+ start:852 stop:1031 length:180 start_codon:yes stop_codon:yes gene_type:complete